MLIYRVCFRSLQCLWQRWRWHHQAQRPGGEMVFNKIVFLLRFESLQLWNQAKWTGHIPALYSTVIQQLQEMECESQHQCKPFKKRENDILRFLSLSVSSSGFSWPCILELPSGSQAELQSIRFMTQLLLFLKRIFAQLLCLGGGQDHSFDFVSCFMWYFDVCHPQVAWIDCQLNFCFFLRLTWYQQLSLCCKREID